MTFQTNELWRYKRNSTVVHGRKLTSTLQRSVFSIRLHKFVSNFTLGNQLISYLLFGSSKLLNISDITKRIGNFFKLLILLFILLLIPNSDGVVGKCFGYFTVGKAFRARLAYGMRMMRR